MNKNVIVSTPLIYRMFEDIGCKEGLRGFGWVVGNNSSLDGLAKISLRAAEKSNLGEVIKEFVNQSPKGSSHANFFITEHKDTIEFCHKGGVNKLNKGYLELELFLLGFFKQFISIITGEKIDLFCAKIRSKASHYIPMKEIRDCQAYLSFLIPKRMLELPNLQKKHNFNENEVEDTEDSQLLNYRSCAPLERLRLILLNYDVSQLPPVNIIAEMEECSTRTLQRELSKANSSYIEIIQEIKMLNAAVLMKNDEFSVENISQQLGYKHVSHFSRAFKKYFSTTPSSYRKNYKR
ncbi:helix-turn-helix transcriptional regulator [Thalassotalea sp. Y01]|uniref:helix-turn-helix transcriptional regulator n=1 Tax=Thalassotalea sp. Y01 TaxID=2729613 RepID=UPI00145F4735|nr:helix-turn-helix transcriptional regulator [Thalassotalea sp. Y01]NMP16009.1 helix-turn-helix transcriptional regulator [Thalassotalea sp. Y01]